MFNPEVDYFQLAALKSAVKLEEVGMKHSSGKSMRKQACLMLGLKPMTPHAEVRKTLQERMDQMLKLRTTKEEADAHHR